MEELSKMENKKTSLCLIGLVDISDVKKGDTIHFSLLRDYLSSTFSVFTISLGKSTLRNNSQTTMAFPENPAKRLIYWNVKMIFILIRKTLKQSINHVHIRPSGLVLSQYLFCLLFRKPFSIEINGLIAESLITSIYYPFIKKVYKYIFRKSKFIAGSPGYMKYIQEEFDALPQKLVEVPLGYSMLPFEESKEACLQKLGLEKGVNYLLSIGNMAAYQGIQYIVDALINNIEDARISKIKLIIVGDGPILQQIIQKIEGNNAGDIFIISPRVTKPELEYYLNLGAIGLSPFSPDRGKEGTISALKTYDYMYHHMPVITSIMDEMSGFIIDNKFGYSIQKFKDEEIFGLIKKAFKEQEEIKEIYKKRWPILKQNFTWTGRFEKIKSQIL